MPPDFCQLFVTSEPYGKHVSLAPRVSLMPFTNPSLLPSVLIKLLTHYSHCCLQFVQEIFGTYGVRPPVLIGGAVEVGLISMAASAVHGLIM